MDDQSTRRRVDLLADESEKIDLSSYKLAAANVCTGALPVPYQAGGTTSIQVGSAEVFTATAAAGASTWEFTGAEASGAACSFVLELTNGGSQTQTWPASVDWPGGAAPALTAAGKDALTFWTTNGGATWSGVVAGKDLK